MKDFNKTYNSAIFKRAMIYAFGEEIVGEVIKNKKEIQNNLGTGI